MSRPAEALAQFLRSERERCHLTLRSVEEQTGISNAYLSQLEHGRIRQPSPVILHKLSGLYGASYANVMLLAGYPMPDHLQHANAPRSFSRLSDVSPEEERALGEYLEFLRARRGSGASR